MTCFITAITLMHSLRTPTLRYSFLTPLPALRTPQRRWARVHDVRFVATHGESASVLEKYRAKLDEKAKREGHGSVDELRAAYKERISSVRRKPTPGQPHASLSFEPKSRTSSLASSQPQSPVPDASFDNSALRAPGIKPLSAYIDIPKVLSLPPLEIEYIWRLRHAGSSDSLYAVIQAPTYHHIAKVARRHPQFILPLPREGQGAEIHFLQWTFPNPMTSTILFTHLAEYKLRGEYSQPHTAITHHLDLADSKGLVLLQGSVLQGRGVSVQEARWLLMCLQKFYAVGGEEAGPRKKLLEQFSQGREDFKVEDLLEEAEKIS